MDYDIALTHLSVQILKNLRVWDRQAVYDVTRKTQNLDIVADTCITSVSSRIDGASVITGDGKIFEASLVVAADSRFSETRRMMGISASMFDFGRVCVVCRMDHDLPHNNIAVECFHYGRTLAVLPLSGNQSSIVITAPMSDRAGIMNMMEDDFNQDVQRRFGDLYGEMRLATLMDSISVSAGSKYWQKK